MTKKEQIAIAREREKREARYERRRLTVDLIERMAGKYTASPQKLVRDCIAAADELLKLEPKTSDEEVLRQFGDDGLGRRRRFLRARRRKKKKPVATPAAAPSTGAPS